MCASVIASRNATTSVCGTNECSRTANSVSKPTGATTREPRLEAEDDDDDDEDDKDEDEDEDDEDADEDDDEDDDDDDGGEP